MQEELKMFCVVRCDIVMPVPKLLVQAGHAYVSSAMVLFERQPELFQQWFDNAQPKIALRCKNLHALLRAEEECNEKYIPNYLVMDAGRTVFNEPTITCLGIGPCYRSELPKFVGNFQLLEDSHLTA